jgi:hypothetical protein
MRLMAAGLGSAVGGSILASCAPPEAAAPTQTLAPPSPTPGAPIPAPVATATARPVPAATATSAPAVPTEVKAVARPEILQMYPAVKSQVIYTHHSGVWSGDALEPQALRKMLDATITRLTGLNDAQAAWKALFSPGESIAIKVNVFRNSLIWTHYPLVQAVTASLIDAGIPAEQILIYDAMTSEFETAAYPVNPDGPGVRCRGTDTSYTKGFLVGSSQVKVSDLLLQCDALINMPVLKAHMLSGVSFAVKNHLGTTAYPAALHSFVTSLPQLSLLPEIKDRTRLVVGDILEANLLYNDAWPYWKADYKGDGLMMSFDPLAADAAAFTVLEKLEAGQGHTTGQLKAMAEPWLQSCEAGGVGASSPDHYTLREINL